MTTGNYQIEPALDPKFLTGNQGYVYIAEIPETGHIKIGRSKTPTKRIKHFDTIMPLEVVTVSWFYADDCVAAEKELHNMLANYRVAGEWFYGLAGDYEILLTIFCYFDGVFHFVEKIEKNCCEQAIYEFVNACVRRGELLRPVDYLPY